MRSWPEVPALLGYPVRMTIGQLAPSVTQRAILQVTTDLRGHVGGVRRYDWSGPVLLNSEPLGRTRRIVRGHRLMPVGAERPHLAE